MCCFASTLIFVTFKRNKIEFKRRSWLPNERKSTKKSCKDYWEKLTRGNYVEALKMGLFSQPKALSPLTTRIAVGPGEILLGPLPQMERSVGTLSLSLLQERQEGSPALPGSSRCKAQNSPGSTKALWVPQFRSSHSPAQPSGFRCSQRNQRWAEPILWETQSSVTCSHGLPLQQFHKPSLAKRSSKKKKKKSVFLLPYLYPLHFT